MPRRKPPAAEPAHEYGSGSCYQRKDGRWAVAFSVNGRRQPPKYFATEREARRYQAGVLARGHAAEPSREPLTAYLGRWLENRAALRNLEPATVRGYELACRRFCEPAYGGLERVALGKLRPHHVEAAVQGLLRAGLAPRTVQLYRSIFSSALKDAVRLELLGSNPVAATLPPRIAKPAPRAVWDAEQVRHFLAVNSGDRLVALWTLMLAIGCRDGEARALRWSDLDAERGTLAIQRGLSQRASYEGDTKTHKARVVELVPALLAVLRAHRARQAEERLAAGPGWRDNGAIFCLPNGRRLTHGHTSGQFEAATKRAGLPRIRLHGTRHTAATILFAADVPVATVSRILGHANPAITYRIYAHVLRQDVSAAQRAMSALLEGAADQAENGTENG